MNNIKMKNSGIEWIGEIPDDWNLIKVGSIFQCRNEKVNDTDYPPLSVSKGGVVPQMDSVAKSDANDNRKLVLQNDFVINSRSDRKQSCGYSTLKGSVSLINTVLYTTNNKIQLPQYTDYLMKNYGFAEEFYRWGHGIVADLWTTRWQEMKSIVLPIPSIDIQQKIADYLDKKCAAVDRLIENQRAQIEKLKGYKQSVITEAVTRGLNPSAPMKDSGIEWLGKIPTNFSIQNVRSLFQIRKEIIGREPETVLSITQSGLKIKNILENEGQMANSYANYQIVHIGDFAMNHMDLLTGGIGVSQYEGVTSPDYRVFEIKEVRYIKKYFLYVFETYYRNKIFYAFGQGAANLGRWRLPAQNFYSIFIPVPPLEEQKQIADYLDKKRTEIDKLISIKQQKIETLTEYKKSLIYEYVTGKKQVG